MQLNGEELMALRLFMGWCFIIPLIFVGGGIILVKHMLRPWFDKHQHFTRNKRELSNWLFFTIWATVCFFIGILVIGKL